MGRLSVEPRLQVVESGVAVVQEAPLNPLDSRFGAAGDGSTDDTAALNAVFAHAKTASGGEVLLPDKVYATSAPVVIDGDNVSVRGMGRGTPTGGAAGGSNPVYGGPVIQPKATFVGAAVLDVAQQGTPAYALSGVDLRGFAIDGFNLPAGVDGIHYQAQRSVIEDVTVARVTGRGVYFEAVDHVTTFPKGVFDLHVRGLIVVGKSTPAGEHGIEVSPGATDLIFEGLIVRSIASGFYGVYDRGSGNQYIGGIVELCSDWGFNIENARNHKLGGGLRIIETHGGVLLGATLDEQTGAWSIVGVTFRNCSEGGDNVRDGIMVDPGSHVMRGGTIGDVDFSTVTRNTSNGRRMRYGINVASANAKGVAIGKWSASYTNPPATSCFGTGPINPGGTATRRSSEVLAQSAVAASHTGDTTETTLATVTIPGGTLGPNGRLRITTVWTVTNNANTKTLRVKFGGTNYLNTGQTTANGYRSTVEIANRNNAASQVGGGAAGGIDGAAGSAIPTSTADTSADQDLTITALLANAADTITLESYIVEGWPS